MVVDPQGMIVAVNPTLARLTGYAAGELVGRSCSLLGCVSCGIQGRGEACVLRGGAAPDSVVCQTRTKDGRRLRLAKRARLLLDAQGRIQGAVELLEPLAAGLGGDREAGMADFAGCQLVGEAEERGCLLGRSPAILGLLGVIDGLAAWPEPVLIRGERGSGRQEAAQALHRVGPWREGPLYRLDGRRVRPGHWTLLLSGRPGDLLLTRLECLPTVSQEGLCRALGLGWLSVRVLAVAGENLAALVGRGEWSEQLYYLLSRQVVETPPLRQRLEDLPELAAHWLERLAPGGGLALAEETISILAAHGWPGNLTELARVLGVAVARCRGRLLLPCHLPAYLRPSPEGRGQRPVIAGSEIMAALRQSRGNQTQAARLLGVSRVTLWKRIKRLGLDPRRAYS